MTAPAAASTRRPATRGRPPVGDDQLPVRVLRALSSRQVVSGQVMGEELGVTRAAVARVVAALRRQGFEISAWRNRGYRLETLPEAPVPAHLLPLLPTRWLGRRVLYREACTSTSDLATDCARRGEPEGLLVLAETQSGGRGRLGRVWFSPAGTLLFSLLLRPAVPPALVPPLCLLAGAVLSGCLRRLGLRPSVKWPNDILLDAGAGPRKAAGILAEMASETDRVRHVVLGIGINVNVLPALFPPELRARATSLAAALGKPVARVPLLVDFLTAFEVAYGRFLAGGPEVAIEAWKAESTLPAPCRVRVAGTGAVIEGIALDLDTDGALQVCDAAGRLHRVVAGEWEGAAA